jgi:pimeloyl-ACP methyl ester carboxylesterase
MLAEIAKQLIRVVPDRTATSIAIALAQRTKRAPVSEREQAAMAQATRLNYGPANRNVAWAWGDGPIVLFAHGWAGRAAQMAPLAQSVADLGYRSVAIDVTGHGESSKNYTRWEYFLRDIAELSRSLGQNIYGYVGHSAGGLAMMAARKVKGISAERYVCICAPSHPFPPVRAIQARLNPRESVLEHYKEYIAHQFETTWERLQAGSSFADPPRDLLLFYDETDRFVSHQEGDRIKSLCPDAKLIKTKAYGHSSILAAPELAEAIGEFLD